MAETFSTTVELQQLEKIIKNAVCNAIERLGDPRLEDKLFTEEEATKYLKCSSVTLWQKRKEGKIKVIKSGRINLYTKSSLDLYLGICKNKGGENV
jgi:hypothetical protein